MDEEMRFMNYIRPPLKEGKYSIKAAQTVTEPEHSNFQENKDFYVTGNAYVLPKEDVFSTFPADNESGEFGDNLPFLVSDKRTFPWDKSICPDQEGVPVPWVALLVISSEEGAVEKDMTIADLWKERDADVYFPDSSKRPKSVVEKDTDLCHVLELPIRLYRDIMPSKKDLPYLCHGRSVNLKKTEDEVCALDGFFSVICANRFVPSASNIPVKSTVHLVSLLGYEDLNIPENYKSVRLVSLYHWDIYSQKASEENFASVIERLKDNCGVMNYDGKTDLQKRGYHAKKHITRTGEQTGSLYRSPLLPFQNEETLDIQEKHTADGRLLYDKNTGIFDVTYAAAWQLGRMITLNHSAIATSMLNVRKIQKVKKHHRLLRAEVDFERLDLEKITMSLVEDKILSKGGAG